MANSIAWNIDTGGKRTSLQATSVYGASKIQNYHSTKFLLSGPTNDKE